MPAPITAKTLEEASPKDFFNLIKNDVQIEEETPEEKAAREQQEQEQQQQRQQKPDKDDSAKVLRQQRDALKKEKEVLEKKLQELEGKDTLGPLKSVKEYILKKFGKDEIDEESVNNFIEHNKNRKQKLEEVENKYKEKDSKLRDIEITMSEDFQENYEKPFASAKETLLATLAPVDAEGQPKNLPFIQALQADLLKTNEDGSAKTALQVKGILNKFAGIYEQKTGEPFTIPNIESVTNGITSVHKKFIAGFKAKQNWIEEQKQKQKEKLFKESETQKELEKRELQGRNFLLSKAEKNFDYKSLEGLNTEDEIKEKLKEKHNKFIKMYKGEEPAYNHDEILHLAVKADELDVALVKIKELNKEVEKLKKNSRPGLPAKGADRDNRQQPQDQPNEDEELEKAPVKDFFSKAHSKIAN